MKQFTRPSSTVWLAIDLKPSTRMLRIMLASGHQGVAFPSLLAAPSDSKFVVQASWIDLGKIDFDALKRRFDKSKHKAASTEA
jgi:hypothetical protein